MNAKLLSLIAAACGGMLVIIFSLAINRPEKRNDATRPAGMKENVDVEVVTERNPYIRSEGY